MRKIYILILVTVMMFSTSIETKACRGFFKSHRNHQLQERSCETDGAVGAPLDGGLLFILAAAGGSYFIARKKKSSTK